MNYYKQVRRELIEIIPKGANRILEIGCGEGLTGKTLKDEERASYVLGIEKNKYIAKKAGRLLDDVIINDVEKMNINEIELCKDFNFVLMGDILEHLVNPWDTLEKLSQVLSPEGRIIVSIPNVRYWKILYQLVIVGEWNYENRGILDKDHLRFFTRKSALQMFLGTKYNIVDYRPKIWSKKERVLNKLTFGIFREYLAYQWIIVADNTKNVCL